MSFLRKAFARRNATQSDITNRMEDDELTKDIGFKSKLGAAWASSTSSLPDSFHHKNSSTHRRAAQGVPTDFKAPSTPTKPTKMSVSLSGPILSPTGVALPSPEKMEAETVQEHAETNDCYSKRGRGAKKKISTSTFHPFLTNLAGFNLSSTTENPTAYPIPDENHDPFLSTNQQQSASANESYICPSTSPQSEFPLASPFDAKIPRRKRKTKPQVTLEDVAESNDSAYLLPPISLNGESSDVPDSYCDIAKILEKAARQARLNVEKDWEVSLFQDQPQPDSPVKYLSPSLTADKGSPLPPPPYVISDANIEPTTSKPFILASETRIDSAREHEEDGHPSKENLTTPPSDEQAELESHPEFLSSPVFPIRDDSVAAPPSSPLPTSDSDHKNSEMQSRDLRLLHLQLEHFKARVDSLVQENSRIMQDHRQEVKHFSDQLNEREAVIKQLTSDHNQAVDKIDFLDVDYKKLKDETNDILQQLKYQVDENHRLEEENRELQKECLLLRELKKKMQNQETEYQELNRGRTDMQTQLVSVQHKLSEAERRVRCLDQLSRLRYEAKQEGAYGSESTVGRSTLLHQSHHVKGPSMDVIDAVEALNSEVLQAASLLVENLERRPSSWILKLPTDTTRAKQVWGSKVLEMLEKQARNPSGFNFLLMQNCLEVFITHWCVEIIEGCYPCLPSFADVLVELASQPTTTTTTNVKLQICGKRVKVITTTSGNPELNIWVLEMVQDLLSLLRVSGFMIRASQSDLLSTRFHPVLEQAYNLRLSLAEKDICGGLELAAPLPDSPFHPEFMEEGHTLERSRKKNDSNSSSILCDSDYIAGTSAIGLKRTLNGQPRVYEMILKPKVVLFRVLEAV